MRSVWKDKQKQLWRENKRKQRKLSKFRKNIETIEHKGLSDFFEIIKSPKTLINHILKKIGYSLREDKHLMYKVKRCFHSNLSPL